MVAKKRSEDAAGETFGQRLARLRKLRGHTQIDFAERVGISQPNVSAYERDAFRPNADTLLRMVEVLKVPADELLGSRSPKERPVVMSRRLLRRLEQIAKLPAHEQRVLLRTIDTFLRGAERAGANEKRRLA